MKNIITENMQTILEQKELFNKNRLYLDLTRQFLSTQHLSLIQTEKLVGLLLGDGNLNNVGINYRFRYGQGLKNFEHLLQVYNDFNNFIKMPVKVSFPKEHFITKQIYPTVSFSTLSHTDFTTWGNLFYLKTGQKVIPQELFSVFSDVSLSNWFMGDGLKHQNGYVLCTDSFSKIEVEFLKQTLIDKYNFTSVTMQVHKSGWRLYFGAKDIINFTSIVKPHIISSMEYKLHKLK